LRIFISYSHNAADTPLARYLAARLREIGLEVWQDESSQPAGEELEEDIEQAIRDSDHAIFIVSKLWLSSRWCKVELNRFSRRDPAAVRLVPVFRLPPERLLLPAGMIDVKGITWLQEDVHYHDRFWEVYCAIGGINPGPPETWGDRSRALTKSSVPPPVAVATAATFESLQCNRAVQWTTAFAVAGQPSHDVMVVPGVVGQAHDHFSLRIRERLLTIPPRGIVSVHWRKRPGTRDEFYAALAEAMQVSPDWLAREMGERMIDANLVLIHPCLRTRYIDPALLSYYTEWLPQLIQQVQPRMSLKCVQPVEWPIPGGKIASLLTLFRLRAAAKEDGQAEAEKFISLVQAGVAPTLRAIRFQDLEDITDKDLDDFCQLEGLTPPQKHWFLTEIKARAPRTSQDMFSAIDALLPDARSVT
jgi:hypothetical protein